jgi:hypothetical protein
MSNIPRARQTIRFVIEELRHAPDFDKKEGIIEMLERAEKYDMRRMPYARPVAPAKSTQITPDSAQAIRDYARDHPEMTLHEIGMKFNVNSGRVSECLHHKR